MMRNAMEKFMTVLSGVGIGVAVLALVAVLCTKTQAQVAAVDSADILLGEWAADCRIPAYDGNIWLRFYKAHEQLHRSTDPETYFFHVETVEWKQIWNGDEKEGRMASLLVLSGNATHTANSREYKPLTVAYAVDEPGKIRVWEAHTGMTPIIIDGKTVDGDDTATFTQCKKVEAPR